MTEAYNLNKTNIIVLHKVCRASEIPINFEDVETAILQEILKQKEMQFVTIDEALSNNFLGRSNICLSFDDGNKSDVDVVLPILLEARAKATFFITTDWIGQAGFLNLSDIIELHNNGMQIGSHGKTHDSMKYMSDQELEEELSSSKRTLENIIGASVESVSFPFGEHRPNSYEIARKVGYNLCCNSCHGLASFSKPYLRRNSINKHTQIEKIASIVRPSAKVKILWQVEDISKKILKKVLSSRYIQIREAFFGKD